MELTYTVLFNDQSSKNCGWSIFRDGVLFKYGEFDLSKANKGTNNEAHTIRRLFLTDALLDLIDQYNVDHVVYEGIFQKNADTFKKLAKIQGSIEEMAQRINVTYEEFIVKQWRSFLPLKLKSQKRDDIKRVITAYVNKLYPETFHCTEDTLEAIAMGVAWHNRKKSQDEWG